MKVITSFKIEVFANHLMGLPGLTINRTQDLPNTFKKANAMVRNKIEFCGISAFY